MFYKILMAKVFLFDVVRHDAPGRTNMNFQIEVLYFFGPIIKVRMVGGNRNTSYFDPSKSIPKFEFSKLSIQTYNLCFFRQKINF